MIDLETLRTLHSKLEQGLRGCRAREADAMEVRLRQEGAVLALEQLIGQAEQGGAVAAIAVPMVEEGDNGSNT